MGSKRTKEDDVLKISTSVFVTNFPEQASAKDLWNACKQYGHVVDAFIPNKRSKAGKRFGFVRFIKVFDVERLVGNLCTVWIGRHRIHANAARFHRPKGSTSSHQPAMKGKIRDSSIGNTKDNGHRDDVSSYANVVKNQSQGNGENDSKPVLVLDDSCVNTQDYSCCLNGKVKEVGVLENLKVALGNEGFTDIDLRYMGGLWVMIAFDSVEAKEKFLLSTGNLDDQNDEKVTSEDEEGEEVFKKVDFGELMRRIIKAIPCEDGKNGSGFKVGYKSIWRSILQEVETLKIKGIHLNNFMQKKLGNGADTYFWEDLWHEDMVLNKIS
ncbi:nucleotide-binding alpha-beta plait domain-containing protein [Tanacetum coccineum]